MSLRTPTRVLRLSRSLCWAFVGTLLVAALFPCAASAQAQASSVATDAYAMPYARDMRQHTYGVLMKSPWRALGWELLLPGAGNFYTGIRVNGYITAAVSVAGAGLWVAGSFSDRDALMWTGIGTFIAGRTYGLITAPLGAMMLNAAFRRQLGVAGRF